MSLGHGADLTEADKVMYAQLCANPPIHKTPLLGTCCGCGRGIPHGYLPIVSKWDTIKWGSTVSTSFNVLKPAEVWCQECGRRVEIKGRRGRMRTPAADKDALIEAMANLSEDTPSHIAASLAERAEALGIDTRAFRSKYNIPMESQMEEVIDAKAIAIAVYQQMSQDTGHTSKKLCQLAGLDEELQPTVKQILSKLRAAGKVDLVDGRWVRC